ncbi:hypothetical protein [Nocardioides sp. 503]|uniref:hypothetical protein n=1 Tax=Nocardioides sp. 503 TaxID=2508326 RepID=UPI00106F61C9|nr:hypothetical protein [Nocardioides sp. 503]
MSLHRLTRTVALAACAALTLGPAGPASAESTVVTDPADVGGASLHDIRSVRLKHGEARVVVRVRFTDLQPESDGGPAGLTVFLDGNPARKGPELRVDTGLHDGSDYQLTRARNWRQVGDRLTCAHSVRLDWKTNVATVRVARACLGTPERVRVAVKMVDYYDGSHPITDWAGKRRSFTPYVTAG